MVLAAADGSKERRLRMDQYSHYQRDPRLLDAFDVISRMPSNGSIFIASQYSTYSTMSSLRSPCSILPTMEWCMPSFSASTRMVKPDCLCLSDFSQSRIVWYFFEYSERSICLYYRDKLICLVFRDILQNKTQREL